MNIERSQQFLERIKKSVIVADGAMGTMVQTLAKNPVDCIEELNLTNPELISEIHRQYVRAGALLIETNTFGANRFSLGKMGLGNKVKEINIAGVKLARQEVSSDGFVAGAIGPILDSTKSISEISDAEIEDIFREQATYLIEAGVDVIILETFADSAQLLSAVRVVKSIAPIPLIASVASGPDGTTYQGEDLRTVFLKLLEGGADVVGLNCGYGIRAIETALAHIGEINAPVSAMPNAGIPERVGGRLIYGVSEEYFAGEAVHLAQMGVKIIGGCCGTTPAHIEAVAQKLREKKIIIKPRHRASIETAAATEQFKQGQFLSSIPADTLPIICEIDPPATLKCEKRIEAIAACVKAGASAISMADNPLATIKINNLAFGALVKRTVDTNIILHVTGRDRNLLGLQSFMLGAHIVGIESLLCVTGDPSHQHGGPSNVFDANSLGLVKMAANLNKGKNLLGKDVGRPTNFSIGVAVNPNLTDFSPQIKHLKNKISAGARFAMTQPLFEAQKIREFISATKELDIKIFIGIFPLLSSRTAEYLHNEVPGIVVPQDLRNMLSAKDDGAYQKQAGLDYTKKLLSEIRGSVDGLYLIAPHVDPEILAGLVEFVKKR